MEIINYCGDDGKCPESKWIDFLCKWIFSFLGHGDNYCTATPNSFFFFVCLSKIANCLHLIYFQSLLFSPEMFNWVFYGLFSVGITSSRTILKTVVSSSFLLLSVFSFWKCFLVLEIIFCSTFVLRMIRLFKQIFDIFKILKQ